MTAPDRAAFEAALNGLEVVLDDDVLDIILSKFDALRAERDAAVAERDKLAGWRDRAVASCAKRNCEMRDRHLREAEAELAALTADNERLRAALTQADATLHSIRGWYLEDMPAPGWEELRERDRLKMESAMLVARAALAEKKP